MSDETLSNCVDEERMIRLGCLTCAGRAAYGACEEAASGRLCGHHCICWQDDDYGVCCWCEEQADR